MSSRNSHSGADDTIIQAEQQTFLTSCVSSPFILCSLSPSTCISLPPPMYTTLFVLKFKSILTVDRAERISHGCFCYGRCDWSARSRKAGCPGAGRCLLILGTGNPPPNLDPVRNSHTLNPTLIFQDSSTPDCRMPHLVQNHVARGIVAMFEVLTGFYGKSTSNGRN